MTKRLFSTTFLSVALLFAQGGSFVIAALCPHLRTGIMRCDMPPPEPRMDHHHMTDMQMDRESNELLLNSDAPAFDRSTETCTHCSVHSGTPSSSFFSARHIEASKRSTDLTIPLLFNATSGPTVIQLTERLTARSHSPPGETVSRYILIDVFRI